MIVTGPGIFLVLLHSVSKLGVLVNLVSGCEKNHGWPLSSFHVS
ncbi:hypothetical protein OROMI_025161 [Orobanche minor]